MAAGPLTWTQLGIAVGIVLILVLAVALARRFEVFNRGDSERATEQLERDAEREELRDVDYTASFLSRRKQYSLPAKVVFAATNIALFGAGLYLYFTLKSGAPVEVPYANAIETAGIVLVATLAGITLKARAEDRRGRLHVIHEDEDGRKSWTETVYFDIDEVEDAGPGGNPLIYEHHKARLFGLFGRRKLAADDPTLRGRVPIPDEIVTHELNESAVQLDDYTYKMRTQSKEPIENVRESAHYRYKPPVHLPFETHLDREERMSKMRQKMDSMKAQLGEAEAEVQRLRERAQEDEMDSIQRSLRAIRDIMDSVPTMGHQNIHLRERGPQRQQAQRRQRTPSSQSEVAERDRARTDGQEGGR